MHRYLLITLLSAAYSLQTYAHSGIHDRIKAVNQHIAVHVDDAEAYVRRAYLLAEHNDWKQVFVSLDQAAGYSADADLIAFDRAYLLREQSIQNADTALLEPALEAVNRFLLIQGEEADAFLLRARLQRALKYKQQALADYIRAIELTEKPQPGLFIEQAELLQAMGRTDAAVTVLEHSIKQTGLATLALVRYALQLEEFRQQPESALVWFERLPPILKRLPNELLYQGDLFTKAGHKERAQQCYCQAMNTFSGFSSRRRRQPAFTALDVKLSARLDKPCYSASQQRNPAPDI